MCDGGGGGGDGSVSRGPHIAQTKTNGVRVRGRVGVGGRVGVRVRVSQAPPARASQVVRDESELLPLQVAPGQ